MRLFLALEFPQSTKNELIKQLDVLYKEYPQFDWIPPKNYHVTIYFFGDIDNPVNIYKRLDEILYDKESFHMYSFHLDMFINHRITIYLDFRREKTLEAIAKQTGIIFQHKPSNRRFVPHVTLARWRIPSKQQYFVLKKRFNKQQIDVSFQVKKIGVFESISSGKFPDYKKMKEFVLLSKNQS